ncbi:hypothetical protein EHR04_12975 [Leptospira levettii]|nr:hypothetical protein [Leptospira levettii]TGM76433.1 hypothetical protein EHR04_12975 [Leptospira levettii]
MNIRKILFYKLGIGGIIISGIITACSVSRKDVNGNNGILALLATISATAGSVTPTLTATGGNLQIVLS